MLAIDATLCYFITEIVGRTEVKPPGLTYINVKAAVWWKDGC